MRILSLSLLANLLLIQLTTACVTNDSAPADSSVLEASPQEASGELPVPEGDEASNDLPDGTIPMDQADVNPLDAELSGQASPDSSPDLADKADAPLSITPDVASEASVGADSTLPSPLETTPEASPASDSSLAQDLLRIQFARNSTKLSADAMASLERVADRLKSEPSLKVKLQGFTDSSGSPALNKRLAKKRARAVKNALVKMGVEKNRLSIGEDRDLNRRVEVIFK